MSLLKNFNPEYERIHSKPEGDSLGNIQNSSDEIQSLDSEVESNNSFEEEVNISSEAEKIILPDDSNELNKEEEKFQPIKRKFNIFSFIASFFYIHYFKCALKWNRRKAKKENISLQDIPYKESIDGYVDEFNKRIEKEGKISIITTKKILKIIVAVFYKDFFGCIFLTSIDIVCRILYSFFIGQLLNSLVNFHDNEKFFWTGILLLTMMAHCIIGHKGLLHLTNLSTKFRLTMITALYYKVLRMNNFYIQKANIGKIVNIIAQDMNIFEGKGFFLIWVITMPVSIIISFVFLWLEFGPICLIALAFFIVIALFQQVLSRFNVRFLKRRNIYSDKRMKFCNEVIEGIRLIKLYAWELAFKKIIKALRRHELFAFQSIHRIFYLDKSVSFNTGCLSAFILLISYHYIYDEELKPNKIFFSLQLLDFVKLICMYYAGAGVNYIFELRVTFLRILDILQMKEFPALPENVLLETDQCLAEFKNYSASWALSENPIINKESPNKNTKINKKIELPYESSPLKLKASSDVLSNINLKIKRNMIYAMFGKVGCGKSSFLLVFLQELPKFTGEFYNKARIAYVEQEPYIMPGTVRENIVFGREFNRTFYKKILYLCSLNQDLERLPNMDLTEIGERGINISGGQKARISLARALYSDADLYLLDDPLSAVDSKVGRHLFDFVIKRYLKNRGKTVILVTHQVHFLREVDNILMMNEGKIVKQGNYSEFNAELEKYFNSDIGKKNKKAQAIPEEKVKETAKKDGKLFTNEEKEKILVDYKLYFRYFMYSKSPLLIFLVVVLFLIWETIRLMIYRIFAMFGTNQLEQNQIFLTIGLLLLGVLIFGALKYFAIISLILRSNKNIHSNMFDGMIKSPVIFFDQTPSGSILNRFSNDLSQLDGNLINSLIDCFELGLMQVGYFVSIAIINVWYLIVIGFLLIIYYFIYDLYKYPLGETKRLDLIFKGPLFTSFSSTITGLLPTRVYAQQKNFQNKYKKLVQNNFLTNTYFYGVSRSFGFQMEFIGVFFASVGLFTVITMQDSQNGLIGQTIMFLIQSTEFIQWTFRQYLSMNTMMSSSARCLNYAALKHEGELLLKSDEEIQKPPKELGEEAHPNSKNKRWPFHGDIEYDRVMMKYREGTDYVLKGLTFKINKGEKVGCVGRTGAGKSSIIQCMFKMVNIEKLKDGSNIYLDNVNINEVGLHTLRGGLSIIPQTPFVFSGSIRRNLDPFKEYSDEEVWDSLDHVDLKLYVSGLEHGLDTDMTNAQNIFSIGQKQLICLARTLLKKNQILVLDEATANVDLDTDELIQKKIKENFSECTVLTIAHRLYTVADYDKIIVMDDGRVAEFDSPFKLLVNDDNDTDITRKGIFSDMVRNTGPETAKKILDIARQKFLSSN